MTRLKVLTVRLTLALAIVAGATALMTQPVRGSGGCCGKSECELLGDFCNVPEECEDNNCCFGVNCP